MTEETGSPEIETDNPDDECRASSDGPAVIFWTLIAPAVKTQKYIETRQNQPSVQLSQGSSQGAGDMAGETTILVTID